MDYSSLAASALRQIADSGREVTLRRVTAGTYHPDADAFSGDDEEDEDIDAVITDYHDRQIDGEIILRGDRKVLIAGSALTSPPTKGDVMEDGDDEYRIVNIETVKPGDTVLLYKLQVRK